MTAPITESEFYAALDKAGQQLDGAIEHQLDLAHDLICRRGATEDEAADFVGHRQRELAEWKAETLRAIAKWLIDPDAPSHASH